VRATWGPPPAREHRLSEEYQQLKGELHAYLLDALQTEKVDLATWAPESLTRYVEVKLSTYVAVRSLAVKRSELGDLVGDLIDELVGLGPLQPLLEDDGVTDILVNGCRRVFADRDGRMLPVAVRFIDDAHVLRIIERMIAPAGGHIEASSPVVDARLADGSRIHAVVHPVTLDGPCLSVRKFRREPLTLRDLVGLGSLSDEMARLLESAVRGRCTVLVSGPSGGGKTALLNALGLCIPADERVVSIESTAELRLAHAQVVRLVTQPAGRDGRGEVSARMLVRHAQRMRPDRLLVGDIRDAEAFDLLQAMSSGHEGSMATLHASTPADCLGRLELLLGSAGFQGAERALRQTIASAVDLVVQVGRLPGGRRCVTSVREIAGVVDDHYQVQDLFRHEADTDRFTREAFQAVGPRLRRALRHRPHPVGLGSVPHA